MILDDDKIVSQLTTTPPLSLPTLNQMLVHMALPWVIIGSSPGPSQQSSSMHLVISKKELVNCYILQS